MKKSGAVTAKRRGHLRLILDEERAKTQEHHSSLQPTIAKNKSGCDREQTAAVI
jgi:hypothetical protein